MGCKREEVVLLTTWRVFQVFSIVLWKSLCLQLLIWRASSNIAQNAESWTLILYCESTVVGGIPVFMVFVGRSHHKVFDSSQIHEIWYWLIKVLSQYVDITSMHFLAMYIDLDVFEMSHYLHFGIFVPIFFAVFNL